MIPMNYLGSDYASFEGNKLSCYYGYEQIDERSEEWCMVIWKGGKEVFRKTNSELLAVAADESPLAMLTAGLSLYLNK